MARRGIFGRLPRAAPDLTASIVALVREAQAQTDSNYVDAWRNGGKVDGKGVPDARLLAHLRERRDMLSPDDPAWDEWNNRYGQYQFAIDESKINLKYDQKKMSDMQVAAFYKKWANDPRVQQDSEFYRHLLDQSAKFVASAKAKAASGRAGSKADAHNNWVQNVLDHGGVQAGLNATGGLLQIAIYMHAAPGDANSLDDVYANSEAWGKVLDVIADGKSDDPRIQEMVDQTTRNIKAAGEPGFTWSESNINGLLTKADRSTKRLEDNATSPSERKRWTEFRGNQNYERTRIKQARATERVEIATNKFAKDLDNCAGDPYCARDVVKAYRDKLVAEEPNLTVQKGGMATASTVDVNQASRIFATIDQLGSILDGKPLDIPAESAFNDKILRGGEPLGAGQPGYTLLDAAGGAGHAEGALAIVGNNITNTTKMLDEGGWVETRQQFSNNAPVLDGHGDPIYDHIVHGAGEPQPPGMIPVPASTMMIDNTRVNGATHGPMSVTPTVWVTPEDSRISVVGPNGDTVDPKGVTIVAGGKEAAAPWQELRGVTGPDGKTRTLYRVPNTSGGQPPYLFLDQPPVPLGTKYTSDGRPIISGTVGTDPQGKATMTVDVTPIMASVAAHTTKFTGTDNYPLGTFTTAGGASAYTAIRDAYAAGTDATGKTAEQRANDFLNVYQTGVNQNTTMTPAERAGSLSDLNQLTKTIDLYRAGNMGKMVDDNYNTTASRSPQQAAYQQQLEAGGFTAQRFGQDEMDRRIGLLASLDAADARIGTRAAAMARQADFTGVRSIAAAAGGGFGGVGLGDLGDLAKARQDIFNPTISVSAIKIPGMQPLMQPGAPGQPGVASPYNPFGFRSPGVPGAPTPFAPPVTFNPSAGNKTPGTFTPQTPSPTSPGVKPSPAPITPTPQIPDRGQTPTPTPTPVPLPNLPSSPTTPRNPITGRPTPF